MRTLVVLCVILCMALAVQAGRVKRGKRKNKVAKVNKIKLLQQSLNDLTQKVKALTSPVHVHLHGGVATGGDTSGLMDKPCTENEVRCLANPCDGATCAAYPDAECRASYCGGCHAQFWAAGREVTSLCDSSPGTNIHVHLSLAGEGGVAGHAGGGAHHEGGAHHGDPVHAICLFGDNFPVKGSIMMTQRHPNKVQLQISLTGLPGRSTHGFHLHEYGDLSKGCSSFGSHYNPHGTEHHGTHIGDWANVDTDSKGNVEETRTVEADLMGSHSILGRGVVVHAKADDSVSGHSAGGRVACCVVAAMAGHA